MTAALLEVRDLRTEFATETGTARAVDGVSFALARGETLAIVGESGSGKSVTSLSIMRLVAVAARPDRRRAGRVPRPRRRAARPAAPCANAQMRRIRGNEIGMIFQEPMSSLNPLLTIGEQIAEVARLHRGMTQAAAMDHARDMLARVNIPDAARRAAEYPHHLSGGMRQRVMIAMALACHPSLLIADEPTTALDVTIQAQILELMRALQVELGMGILFITHNLGVVAEIADRVAVMYAGRIVEQGAVDAVFARPLHPYTRALLLSIPRLAARQVRPAAAGDPGPGSQPRCPAARLRLRRRAARWPHRVCLEAAPPEQEALPIASRALPPMGRRMIPPLLEVEDLEVTFRSRDMFAASAPSLRAVAGVGFTIQRGEVLGLVGESGSGKTTIGRAILRLLEPSGGTIRFDGDDITPSRPAGAAAIPAADADDLPGSLFQPQSAPEGRRHHRRGVHHPRHRHGARPARPGRGDAAAGRPAGGRRCDRYPHEFSGGQRQRIGIARALAVGPDFIVADEPVSALDVSVQAQVLNLLLDLQQSLGLAMLFIAHDLAVVQYISDRVVVLYLGRIMEIAPADALYRRPRHPYTAALLEAVPDPDPARRPATAGLRGEIPSPYAPPSGCVFRTRCPFAVDACTREAPVLREVAAGHAKACLRDDIL